MLLRTSAFTTGFCFIEVDHILLTLLLMLTVARFCFQASSICRIVPGSPLMQLPSSAHHCHRTLLQSCRPAAWVLLWHWEGLGGARAEVWGKEAGLRGLGASS